MHKYQILYVSLLLGLYPLSANATDISLEPAGKIHVKNAKDFGVSLEVIKSPPSGVRVSFEIDTNKLCSLESVDMVIADNNHIIVTADLDSKNGRYNFTAEESLIYNSWLMLNCMAIESEIYPKFYMIEFHNVDLSPYDDGLLINE